jgi:hypothetical protein
MKNAALIVLATLVLAGCFGTTKYETRVLIQKEYVAFGAAGAWLDPTPLPAPPKLNDYLPLSHDEREDYMARRMLIQYELLAICNRDKLAQAEALQTQKAEIEKLNEQERLRIKTLKNNVEALNGEK